MRAAQPLGGLYIACFVWAAPISSVMSHDRGTDGDGFEPLRPMSWTDVSTCTATAPRQSSCKAPYGGSIRPAASRVSLFGVGMALIAFPGGPRHLGSGGRNRPRREAAPRLGGRGAAATLVS